MARAGAGTEISFALVALSDDASASIAAAVGAAAANSSGLAAVLRAEVQESAPAHIYCLPVARRYYRSSMINSDNQVLALSVNLQLLYKFPMILHYTCS